MPRYKRNPDGTPSPDAAPHGTETRYQYWGCRCGQCRAAVAAKHARWIAALQDRPASEIPHGTLTGYRNWGCRCGDCATAGMENTARRKKKGNQ